MTAPITGTVTPPDDLQPAIDALGPIARGYLEAWIEEMEGQVTPRMIAQAADYGREHGES